MTRGMGVGTGAGAAVAVYQVRLDAWRRVPEEGNRPLTPGEAAGWLAGHLRATGFTHVEIAAPAEGAGRGAAFADLVGTLRDAGAGVLLEQALPPGGVVELERPEALAAVLSSSKALLGAGAAGLRLAIPPGADGRLAPSAERLVAVLGETMAARHPRALLVLGGPGGSPRALPAVAPPRTLLWREDWEGRTREYLALDPIHRAHRHDLVVRGVEDTLGAPALLPFSCGGATLLGGLWGQGPTSLDHLRLALGYAWCAPGAKLLCMGDEFGQRDPRRADGSLDWHLLGEEPHRQALRWVAHLNILLRGEPALGPGGSFSWVDAGDREQSVVCFERDAPDAGSRILVVCNFTPVPRPNYRIGASRGGLWAEILNSDAREYGGRGMGNLGGAEAAPVPFHGRRHSLSLLLPPLSVLVLRAPAP